MIAKKIEALADVLMENEPNENINKDIIVYGLSSVIEQGASTLTIIVLGLISGLAVESIVFLISLMLIRTYAGGYHCNKALNCYFMSSATIIIVLKIVKVTPNTYIAYITPLLLILGSLIIIKLTPIEAKTKPLDKKERKCYRKKTIRNLSILCVVAVVLLLIRMNTYAYTISLSVMVTGILVLMGFEQAKRSS